MRRALTFVVLAACGGSDASLASGPAQPPPDPAPCPDVATRELQLMNIGFLGDQKTGAMKTKIERRCHDDSWSLDARRCILTATGFDDIAACNVKLTTAQRAAYDHELRGSNDVAPDSPPPPPTTATPELLK